MPGILKDVVKIDQLFTADSRSATGVLFNGAASASGVDTQNYDTAVVIINAGTFASAASSDFALYESDTADSSAATAITGADFTTITAANDEAVQLGSVLTKGGKRWLFLRAEKTLNTNAADYSAVLIQGSGDKNPSDDTYTFSV